jgi:hypothetical protein
MRNFGLCLMAACLLAAGCDNGEGEAGRDTLAGEADARSECLALCEYALADDVDLSDGPCLSEEVVDNWACDVVHDPREDADDLSTNQCDSVNDGWVDNVVELTPDCGVPES